jgi:hypothetical protein
LSFVFGIAGAIKLASNFESSKIYSQETIIATGGLQETILNLD